MRHILPLAALLPLLAALLPLAGCGSAASLVLKDPIVDKCSSAGIQGCPDLADGVLLFIDEKPDEGREKIEAGVAANSPEQLREFAVVLKQIGNIPGADRYMGPVLEVAKIITGKANERSPTPKKKGQPEASPEAKAEAPEAEAPARPAPVVSPAARLPSHWTTADTDVERLASGIVAPGVSPSKVACEAPFGLGASWCDAAVKGPFVVTDLWMAPGCQADMFAAAADTDSRAWSVAGSQVAPLVMHSGHLFVRAGQSLIIGAHGKGAADPKCAVTWGGFRPYVLADD